jgi:hypothetical protein
LKISASYHFVVSHFRDGRLILKDGFKKCYFYRELAEKVEKVARKEKELNEKISTEILITSTYPDPNEP